MGIKLFGLAAFIATGGGLIISTVIKEQNFFSTEILVIIAFFFIMSLFDHFNELMVGDDRDEK